MRTFSLFLDVMGEWIPISTPLNSNNNLMFSTYDEKLEEQDNSQYSLSFSIVTKQYEDVYKPYHISTELDGGHNIDLFYTHFSDYVENPLLSFYNIGAKLYLVLDGGKRIDLIIKNISPTSSSFASVFNITAQDELSYSWSRRNVGYNYSTLNNDGNLSPKSIFEITKEVLADNYLTDWNITSQSYDSELQLIKFSLELQDSNPYNVLIEACNTVNARLIVNYYTKTIDYIRKTQVEKFSGYRYTPNRNIINYSASGSGEELLTMLHVSGGTDAEGKLVTIIPAIPQPIRLMLGDIGEETWSEDDDLWNTLRNKNKDKDEEESFYKKPNTAFVPVSKIIINNSSNISFIDPSFIIEFNEIENKYYGVINALHASDDGEQYNYIFKFAMKNGEDSPSFPGTQTINDTEYQFTIGGAIITTISADPNIIKPIRIILTQNKTEISQFIQNIQIKQHKEVDDFFKVVNHIPYLGQTLIDFSPFKHMLDQDSWNYLNNILIKKIWRNLNIKLQLLTTDYYSALININTLRARIINYGEIYLAACNNHDNIIKNSASTEEEKESAYAEVAKSLANLQSVIKNSDYVNIVKTYGKTTENSETCWTYFEKLNEENIKTIHNYDQKIAELSAEQDTRNGATIQYYLDKKKTLLNFSYGFSTAGHSGLYPVIINIIKNINGGADSLENGLYINFHACQEEIQNKVFAVLYNRFGNIIYENSYDNADELDSISLFNQAIIYFADLNKIQTSHSLETIDIGELEQVNIPRLSVGSLIQVFNSDSINAQAYRPYLENIRVYEKLCQHYCNIKQNDLYEEMKDKVEAAKEELIAKYKYLKNISESAIIDYNTVCDDIYNDSIIVTGISRVLREPLKDSVTVEQNSRYKTILSKLIKSV